MSLVTNISKKKWLGTLTILGFRTNSFKIAAVTHVNGSLIAALIADIFVALYVWKGVRLGSVLICTAGSEYESLLRVHG